jgi:hypothetical protein
MMHCSSNCSEDGRVFTVSDDGCLLIIDVRDKKIRASDSSPG